MALMPVCRARASRVNGAHRTAAPAAPQHRSTCQHCSTRPPDHNVAHEARLGRPAGLHPPARHARRRRRQPRLHRPGLHAHRRSGGEDRRRDARGDFRASARLQRRPAGQHDRDGARRGSRAPRADLLALQRDAGADRQMLAGLDALVIDLQDIGARIYTFVYTMANCLRAAARHGVKVFVCDRPNPIGGVEVRARSFAAGSSRSSGSSRSRCATA